MSFLECRPKIVKKIHLGATKDRIFYKRLQGVVDCLNAGQGVRISKKAKKLALQLLEKKFGLQKDCILSLDEDCCNCTLWMPDCICTFLGYHTQTKRYYEPYEDNKKIQLDHTPAFPDCLFVVKNGHLILRYGTHFTVSGDCLYLKYGNENTKEDCPDTYCISYEYKSGDGCPTCGYGCHVETFTGNYPSGTEIGLDDPFLIPDSVQVFMKGRFQLKRGKDFEINTDCNITLFFDGVVEPDCPHQFVVRWAQYGEVPDADNCYFSNKKCECFEVDSVPAGYFLRLRECPVPESVEVYWGCPGAAMTNALTPRKEGMLDSDNWDYEVIENTVQLNPTWMTDKAGEFCVRYSY